MIDTSHVKGRNTIILPDKTYDTVDKDALMIVDMLYDYCDSYTAFIVGGAARDIILGRVPKDWDICTNALPQDVTKIFSNIGCNVLPTGINHGTVTVMVNNKPIEVTTYRLDGNYDDGRRPSSVKFAEDVEDDLARRDFTINAMAFNSSGLIIDPFKGTADIKNKIIRCVGNPHDRFAEDGLRILRALRFAAQLGFTIEEETSKAIHECKHMLDNVSKERVRDELCKILMSDFCGYKVLDEYKDVFYYIIPELRNERDFMCINHSYSFTQHVDIITRLALFFKNVEDPMDQSISAKTTNRVLRELKFSNETVAYVTQLVSYRKQRIYDSKPGIKRKLNKIGYEQLKRLMMLQLCEASFTADGKVCLHNNHDKCMRFSHAESLAKEIIENNECYTLKQLAVNGDDLIEAGVPQGKKIKYVLYYLLDRVIDGDVENEKGKLLDKFKSMAGFY